MMKDEIKFIEEPIDLLDFEMSKIYGGIAGFCFVFCGCNSTTTYQEECNKKNGADTITTSKQKIKLKKQNKVIYIHRKTSQSNCFIVVSQLKYDAFY